MYFSSKFTALVQLAIFFHKNCLNTFNQRLFFFNFLTSIDCFLNLPTLLRNQEQLKIFFLFNFPINYFMINTGSCVNI